MSKELKQDNIERLDIAPEVKQIIEDEIEKDVTGAPRTFSGSRIF